MALVVNRNNGGSLPRLVCDACSQPIEEMEGALVTYSGKSDGNGNSKAYVYHKGDCDPSPTPQGERPEHAVYWIELDQYLPWLLWNHGWGKRGWVKNSDTVTLEVPESMN